MGRGRKRERGHEELTHLPVWEIGRTANREGLQGVCMLRDSVVRGQGRGPITLAWPGGGKYFQWGRMGSLFPS